MGNQQGRESRPSAQQQYQTTLSRHTDPTGSSGRPERPTQAHSQRHGSAPDRQYYSRSGSGRVITRQDTNSIFSGVPGPSRDADPSDPTARRETRAEREARKLEKERAQRAKDREKSLKEEHVDGGYLVTLGTYTGTEDFNKAVVRRLQIERRLAPFWRGLEDFDELWTEHQIIAAAKGLPVPAADESPPEEIQDPSPPASDQTTTHLTVPITGRSRSQTSNAEMSPTSGAFSVPSPSSPLGSPPANTPFFRGRAKTLAALSTSRSNSEVDVSPKEIQMPRDPYVNGQRLELYLYKNAAECPICFLYYPPYLNQTRCCDQEICSECFVQIKRPDPHPPEHHDEPADPNAPPPPPTEQSEEYQLVSEPATCPFCKMEEFGITYAPPPFKRGLAYPAHGSGHGVALGTSAMSSSSSLQPGSLLSQTPPPTAGPSSRRRKASLGVNEPSVITTDKVRPDWAKKLSDARAHALRRAAAATALHNAAYVLGNAETSGRFGLGRRRRTLFGDGGPEGAPALGGVAALMAAADRHSSRGESGDSSGDLFPGRGSSRRPRIEDLEELMMMEAIRLSIAAEEERQKKEEKEAEKQKKKDAKTQAKEQKKADKAAKKSGNMYHASNNASSVSGSFSQVGASSMNLVGKGKDIDRGGSADPYGLGATVAGSSGSAPAGANEAFGKQGAQRHLEQSRAHIQSQGNETGLATTTTAGATNSSSFRPWRRHNSRQLSITSSIASTASNESLPFDSPNHRDHGQGSSGEASPNASGVNLSAIGRNYSAALGIPGGGAGHYSTSDPPSRNGETPPAAGTPSTEPMFNFSSLAAVIGREDPDAGEGLIEYGDVTTPLGGSEVPAGGVFDYTEGDHPFDDAITPTIEHTSEERGLSANAVPPPVRVVPDSGSKHAGVRVSEGGGSSGEDNSFASDRTGTTGR